VVWSEYAENIYRITRSGKNKDTARIFVIGNKEADFHIKDGEIFSFDGKKSKNTLRKILEKILADPQFT
jgi:hypothetical protein